MDMKRRFPLHEARLVADELVGLLQPVCERIQVAGSVRRLKPDVGDIELLCISRAGSQDLFGDVPLYLLDGRVQELIQATTLGYRLNKDGHRTFGPLNKLLYHVRSEIPVDIFITTVEDWGMGLVIRTGPKAFNIRVMERFRQLGMRGHAYGGVSMWDGLKWIEEPCPTEEAVFRLLQWDYIPPEARV